MATDNALAVQQETAVAPMSTRDMLVAVAQQSTPEQAVQLFALLERADKWDAEKQFTAAFSRLKFPPIVKNKKGHGAKYADFADVQSVIDPILEAEGFTLTYSSGSPNAQGLVPTYGCLSHVGGHSRSGEVWLPPDGVATKSGGMNMNALQAVGSATSYGQRYVAKLMLNLKFIGDDKDGAVFLGEKERNNIEDILHELGEEVREPFLRFMGCKSVSDVPTNAYTPAINYLTLKRKRMGETK